MISSQKSDISFIFSMIISYYLSSSFLPWNAILFQKLNVGVKTGVFVELNHISIILIKSYSWKSLNLKLIQKFQSFAHVDGD